MLEVTLTGTGMPRPDPNRAGPGVLVRVEGLHIQVDAGRATTLRLAQVGVQCSDIDILAITHHHSDHVMGVTDLVMSRWIERGQQVESPQTVIAPDGPSVRFLERLMYPWEDDLEVRVGHAGNGIYPRVDVKPFTVGYEPQIVWQRGEVTISSVQVRHEPVVPAVAYRIDSPDGSVVISGDTVVCDEVAELSQGANVLVHSGLSREGVRGLPYEWVADYHADSVQIGALALGAGVDALMLTHLLPAPNTPALRDLFVADVRAGGYMGEVLVGEDLDTVQVSSGAVRLRRRSEASMVS